ncbi:MAG: C4-type zinc ribbon domain-containing protein [Actinomycetota bacterium]|nr:C4-type zinc ribbon domain-containing protein [Actinomycetota bacterium]
MSTDPTRAAGAEQAAGAEEAAGAEQAARQGSALEVLLLLQDIDTAISQLEHRKAALAERQELARVSAVLGDLEKRMEEAQASRAELASRQRAIEAEISTVDARREALEQRMYTARGAPSRDLQAMDDEIRHLRERKGRMEDEELELMVAIEPLDAALAELDAQSTRLRSDAARLAGALAEAEAEIDAQLAAKAMARASEAAALPGELRSRYEALRARLGGTGAARLVGNRCSGCHLELPSMEVDRIRHLPGGTVVTCEQCGRILVPVAPPAG